MFCLEIDRVAGLRPNRYSALYLLFAIALLGLAPLSAQTIADLRL